MDKVKKYIQPALCAVAFIALLVFPYVNNDWGYGIEDTYTGFLIASSTYIGYLQVVLPALLLIVSILPKYEKKRPILSLLIPPVCIIAWCITTFVALNWIDDLADSTLAGGAFVALVCFIALTIYGCIIYRNELKMLIEGLKRK